jgi:hypothetical protein
MCLGFQFCTQSNSLYPTVQAYGDLKGGGGGNCAEEVGEKNR